MTRFTSLVEKCSQWQEFPPTGSKMSQKCSRWTVYSAIGSINMKDRTSIGVDDVAGNLFEGLVHIGDEFVALADEDLLDLALGVDQVEGRVALDTVD